MEILVNRIYSDNDATLSNIYVDGEFVCFGLEDEYREHKISRETRIPAGTYDMAMRDVGGFHNRYKKKFSFHLGMLQVLNVPGFEYILIHIGNTDDDTAGCLLVGNGALVRDEIIIQYSTSAYKTLYQVVSASCLNRDLQIEYRDSDRRE